MLSNRSTRQGRVSRPPPSREVEYKYIQDTINDICNTIKKFAQRFFPEKEVDYRACHSCCLEIVKIWNIDIKQINSWKDFMEKVNTNNIDKDVKVKSIYADLIHIFDRAKEFEHMIPHIRERTLRCVKDHVYKYCHSFVEETGGVDAKIIAEYEDQIRSNKSEIEDKFNSINADILRYSEMKSPLEKFITEAEIIAKLMESICVQIVEVCHVIKQWINDDAMYPDKLQQEILFNNGYRETLQVDVEKLFKRKSSLERSLERRQKANRKVDKDYTKHKQEKRRRKESLHTVKLKIERWEFQIAQKSESIEGTKTALSSRRTISPRQEEELHATLSKTANEIDRLNEWLTVMRRQKTRLEKELKEISDRTYELKVELVTNRHDHEEMQSSKEGMEIELKSMRERLDDLDRKSKVMKHIRILKMSPETLRKLYRRRREFYQQGM